MIGVRGVCNGGVLRNSGSYNEIVHQKVRDGVGLYERLLAKCDR
jgi:hypothetical protein